MDVTVFADVFDCVAAEKGLLSAADSVAISASGETGDGAIMDAVDEGLDEFNDAEETSGWAILEGAGESLDRGV